MKKIEFFKHNINGEDIKNANRVLRSIFLTTGKEVEKFEHSLSRYTGLKFSVGLTSCTAALHLSLLALGIGPGDEVITSPMSFCATANAIIQAGAKPVFVDVEEDTGNMNAELIESAITKRTRAVIPVHLYGQMCDMARISEIAKKHNLKVIEDAAHSIEGSRDRIRAGELSDAACYSFYATKSITSGEGGALSTNKAGMARAVKQLRLHGIDSEASNRYTKRYQHWDMPVFGWKYNMDNIQAALLSGQLRRMNPLWKRRDRLWQLYEDGLKGVKGIQLFTVLAPPKKRDPLLRALQGNGIGVAVHYRPVHLLKYYRKSYGYKRGSFPVAESVGDRTLSLPLYPLLKINELRYVVQALKGAL
jgi:dTDP-4-amino-4,6-dideoxygalactose transaminase